MRLETDFSLWWPNTGSFETEGINGENSIQMHRARSFLHGKLYLNHTRGVAYLNHTRGVAYLNCFSCVTHGFYLRLANLPVPVFVKQVGKRERKLRSL